METTEPAKTELILRSPQRKRLGCFYSYVTKEFDGALDRNEALALLRTDDGFEALLDAGWVVHACLVSWGNVCLFV